MLCNRILHNINIYEMFSISEGNQRVDRRLEWSVGYIGTSIQLRDGWVFIATYCFDPRLSPLRIRFRDIEPRPIWMAFGKLTTSRRGFLWPDSISKPLYPLLRHQTNCYVRGLLAIYRSICDNYTSN